MSSLIIYAASGSIHSLAELQRARRRLSRLTGMQTTLDPSVRHRSQRFAGTDEQRLETLHRVARLHPSVALAARGGYGLSRLLDRIDWPLLQDSVERGTRWVGYSDLTALQLGLLAHTGCSSWHGPLAADDFGRECEDEDETERLDVTRECFREAMSGELEAIGFRTEPGFEGLSRRGRLWGGNLTMVCSLLGTRHWPKIRSGLLFLEDVGEHPYRVERLLLQLAQAGVLQSQRAVLLGSFSAWKPAPNDRGYGLKDAVQRLRAEVDTPILTGLPIGHLPLKVCIPQGVKAELTVDRRQAFLSWVD